MKNQLWKQVLIGNCFVLGAIVASVATAQESATDTAEVSAPDTAQESLRIEDAIK